MITIFDDLIQQELNFMTGDSLQKLTKNDLCWEDEGKPNVVFKNEMAYELGGNGLSAISNLQITGNVDLINENGIFLWGKDLPDISSDNPYARITLIRLKDQVVEEANSIYEVFHQIENMKYLIHPKDYMIRVSSTSQREQIRIGKMLVSSKIGFRQIGDLYMQKYLKHPIVDKVQIYFLTDPSIDYEMIMQIGLQTQKRTEGLDHIWKGLSMDCKTCNLKEVCDEVEGMRELHFHAIKE